MDLFPPAKKVTNSCCEPTMFAAVSNGMFSLAPVVNSYEGVK